MVKNTTSPFPYVLEKDIDDISTAVRAKKKRRLPVVLTQDEVHRLFEKMSVTADLMAKLIYGFGLRLQECIKLRVKDIDFERRTVTVRAGKGDKDRETVLPDRIQGDLKTHFQSNTRTDGTRESSNDDDIHPCRDNQKIGHYKPSGQKNCLKITKGENYVASNISFNIAGKTGNLNAQNETDKF
jgi:integrase